MATTTTIVENEDQQTPPAASDRVLELAERVGAMTAREEARAAEVAEVRFAQSQILDSVRSLSESVSALSRQTESAERTAEAAATVAVATAAEVAEEEEEEDDSGVLEVNPEIERTITVTEKPAKNPNWFQKMIFGK
jgi:hypothetical protein